MGIKEDKCMFLVAGKWCSKLDAKCLEVALFSGVEKGCCNVRETDLPKRPLPPPPMK